MSESGAIDAALSAKLLNDAALTALMPDGIFFDIARKDVTRFVLISLINEDDDLMFNGRAFEEHLYLVKAVALATTGADVRAAAARIDVLLDGPDALAIAGYSDTRIQRIHRVRYTEVDDTNETRWQHRGGHYELWAVPLGA